jgi:hypothetical protein
MERQDSLPTRRGSEGVDVSGDVHLLIDRCAFIRHCRDEAATLTEPEWYSMVSNVGRCIDGQAAVHQLSAPYPGYSPRETDAKIAHALQDSGPHTCAFIQSLVQVCPPDGCGVKAPIALSHPVRAHTVSDTPGKWAVRDHTHSAGGLRVRAVTPRDKRAIRTIAAQEVPAWRC